MKSFCRKSAVLLVSIASLAAGFAAAAAPANARTGIDTGDMASDGVRYFAYMNVNHVPVVLDTWERKVNRIRGAKSCLPSDIGGSRVLLSCFKSDENGPIQKTASVRGGKAKTIHGGKGSSWYRIGRFWLEGNPPCGSGGCTAGRAYLNWRTGKRGQRPGIPDYYESVDLDHRHLSIDRPDFVPAGHDSSTPICWDDDVVVTERQAPDAG